MPTRGFSVTTELAVPPAEAFAFLADPDTAPIIDPAVRRYQPDHLPMGEGTHVLLRVSVWGLPVRAVSEVRAWEPGRRMVMESIEPPGPVRVRAEHTFADAGGEPGATGCVYTWSAEVRSSGPLGRLFLRPVTAFLRRNARRQQERFKAAVEPGPDTAAPG